MKIDITVLASVPDRIHYTFGLPSRSLPPFLPTSFKFNPCNQTVPANQHPRSQHHYLFIVSHFTDTIEGDLVVEEGTRVPSRCVLCPNFIRHIYSDGKFMPLSIPESTVHLSYACKNLSIFLMENEMHINGYLVHRFFWSVVMYPKLSTNLWSWEFKRGPLCLKKRILVAQ